MESVVQRPQLAGRSGVSLDSHADFFDPIAAGILDCRENSGFVAESLAQSALYKLSN
jgi:hypothetical protein